VQGAETDSAGLPWDARIHSKSADGVKGKNKDGTWRQRRNLADGVKEAVEAELRGLVALNAGAAPVTGGIAPDAAAAFHARVAAQAAAAPAAPPAPPVAPSSVNPLGPLLMKIAPLFASGKVTPQQADAIAQKHGLANLTQLALTPNLVPAVEADIDALAAA